MNDADDYPYDLDYIIVSSSYPSTNDQCVVNHDIRKNELSAIVGFFDSSAIDYDVGTEGNIDITITHINKF